MLSDEKWKVHNSKGVGRVVVTMELPGKRCPEILTRAGSGLKE